MDRDVAQKVFKKKKAYEEELAIYLKVERYRKHRRAGGVVDFLGCFPGEKGISKPWIRLELAHCNLYDVAFERKDGRWTTTGCPTIPTSAVLFTIVGNLLSGIFFLHEVVKLLHCDLKPENVLVVLGDDLTTVAKAMVGDLGLAKPTTSAFYQRIGTLDYTAPECFTGAAVNANSPKCQSDVFSLGLTLFRAIEGRPMNRMSEKMLQIWNKIQCQKDGDDINAQWDVLYGEMSKFYDVFSPRLTTGRNLTALQVPDGIAHLIGDMCKPNYCDRPTIKMCEIALEKLKREPYELRFTDVRTAATTTTAGVPMASPEPAAASPVPSEARPMSAASSEFEEIQYEPAANAAPAAITRGQVEAQAEAEREAQTQAPTRERAGIEAGAAAELDAMKQALVEARDKGDRETQAAIEMARNAQALAERAGVAAAEAAEARDAVARDAAAREAAMQQALKAASEREAALQAAAEERAVELRNAKAELAAAAAREADYHNAAAARAAAPIEPLQQEGIDVAAMFVPRAQPLPALDNNNNDGFPRVVAADVSMNDDIADGTDFAYLDEHMIDAHQPRPVQNFGASAMPVQGGFVAQLANVRPLQASASTSAASTDNTTPASSIENKLPDKEQTVLIRLLDLAAAYNHRSGLQFRPPEPCGKLMRKMLKATDKNEELGPRERAALKLLFCDKDNKFKRCRKAVFMLVTGRGANCWDQSAVVIACRKKYAARSKK